MKKFRKLIPALCMLLVSALFVGTSTYAWFSMNKEVAATGMEIEAKSDSIVLVINEGDTFNSAGTATEVTSTAAKKALYPVAPVKGTTLTSENVATPASWNYAYSDANDKYQAATAYTKCTDLANYVASETFSIGLNDKSGVTSAGKLRLTGVTLPTDTGISVVVVCGDKVYKHDATAASLTEELADSVNTTGTVVTVYYYINGENTNVYSNNETNLTGKVTLNFDVENAIA